MIKPSEIARHSAAVLQRIVEASLSPSCYRVVQGGVAETQALLREPWGKIFFTGSPAVGRMVATAAGATLTPVVLELGGLNPAIVSKRADPALVARRLLWAKVMNAGQTCTSQNYVLAEREIVPALVAEMRRVYQEFYPNGAAASPEYARIISPASFRKIKQMLESSRGTVLMGGETNEHELYIEPTLVQIDALDDPLLRQESFGPLVPLLPVKDLDEAVDIANQIQRTPLGLSVFGDSAEVDRGKLTKRSDSPSHLVIYSILLQSHQKTWNC